MIFEDLISAPYWNISWEHKPGIFPWFVCWGKGCEQIISPYLRRQFNPNAYAFMHVGRMIKDSNRRLEDLPWED